MTPSLLSSVLSPRGALIIAGSLSAVGAAYLLYRRYSAPPRPPRPPPPALPRVYQPPPSTAPLPIRSVPLPRLRSPPRRKTTPPPTLDVSPAQAAAALRAETLEDVLKDTGIALRVDNNARGRDDGALRLSEGEQRKANGCPLEPPTTSNISADIRTRLKEETAADEKSEGPIAAFVRRPAVRHLAHGRNHPALPPPPVVPPSLTTSPPYPGPPSLFPTDDVFLQPSGLPAAVMDSAVVDVVPAAAADVLASQALSPPLREAPVPPSSAEPIDSGPFGLLGTLVPASSSTVLPYTTALSSTDSTLYSADHPEQLDAPDAAVALSDTPTAVLSSSLIPSPRSAVSSSLATALSVAAVDSAGEASSLDNEEPLPGSSPLSPSSSLSAAAAAACCTGTSSLSSASQNTSMLSQMTYPSTACCASTVLSLNLAV